MNQDRVAWLLGCVAVTGVAMACGPSPRPDMRQAASVPVAATEVIVGRAGSGDRVRLLTADRRLILIDIGELRVLEVSRVELDDDRSVWGLVESSDGVLWTLSESRRLVRFSAAGQVLGAVDLPLLQIGLYGWQDRFIVQEANFEPEAPALVSMTPHLTGRRPFGNLRLRTFEEPVSTLAGNLVLCGSTAGAEMPCWFSHTLEVHRITMDGRTDVSVVDGLGLESLAVREGLEIEAPRPIRDAHIDAGGHLWLLTRRAAGPGGDPFESDAGRQLSEHAPDGHALRVVSLDEPGRLILGSANGRVVVLSISGRLLPIAESPSAGG